MPRRRRTRVPVQQQHRRPSTAMPYEDRQIVTVDEVVLEALEHPASASRRPMRRSGYP